MSPLLALVVPALVAGVLLAASHPLIRSVATRPGNDRVVRIMWWGLVLKLLASPVYLQVVASFYEGVADYNRYHGLGTRVAEALRVGDFGFDVGPVVGEGFVGIVTGVLYAVVGPSRLAGFLVFSWLAFVGMFFFFRAFETTFPGGDRARYAALLFLFPTMVFWSSALGKDAFMVFGLGIGAFGAARVLANQRGGSLALATGAVLTLLVRPHMALLLLCAAAVGFAARRSVRSPIGPAVKVVGLAALVVGTLLVSGRVADFVGVESLSPSSVSEVLDETEKNTLADQQGDETTDTFGSSVEGSGSRGPLQYPRHVVTVLFRPFPYEARNVPAVVASAEGVLLLAIVVRARRRLAAVPRLLRRHPYVLMSLAYVVVAILLFSSFRNLGLLARQRVQLLPALFVLLSLPTAAAPRPVRERSIWVIPHPEPRGWRPAVRAR